MVSDSPLRFAGGPATVVEHLTRIAMASQPTGAGLSDNATGRGLRTAAAAFALLLSGIGLVLAQPAPSASPSFPARIEAAARALQNNPRLKNLTEQQRIDRVEFVVGNTLTLLLHEMGHVHISEMHLPVLGREEDAADTFSALRLLRIGSDFSQRSLADAAKGWFLNDRRDQQTGEKPLFYDEHNLSQQRAYQLICLMVGSDPVKFKGLADETKMPESRQKTCKRDYAKASAAWDSVLMPYRRVAGKEGAQIKVVYGDGMGRFDALAELFRSTRFLETVVARAEADYVWPSPFTLQMQTCGHPGADFEDETRVVTMCYESASDFAELYRAYVEPPPAPIGKRKRSK
jgi:hypothetical protein